MVTGAWLLGAGNRGSYLAASPADQAAFDPVFTVLQGIELAQLFVGTRRNLDWVNEWIDEHELTVSVRTDDVHPRLRTTASGRRR